MWELFIKGGPIMYSLLLCSLGAFYIIIQKYLFLNVQAVDADTSLDTIKSQLLNVGKEETLRDLRSKRKIILRVAGHAIKYSHLDREAIRDSIKEASINEVQKLEQGISLLSGLITVTPILGLMGTVLGIMDIFNVISGGHIGSPELLSKGIAEALITTVSGLGIAIPCILLYQYLRNRIDTILMGMEKFAYNITLFIQDNDSIKN